jgi:hypothetical protein
MAQLEMKRSWLSNIPIDEAQERLNWFLHQQQMRVVSSSESQVIADQGAPPSEGLTEGWAEDAAMLPKRATIRLTPAGQGVEIEAVIEETLGPDQLDAHLQNRYEGYFSEWIGALAYALAPTRPAPSVAQPVPPPAAPAGAPSPGSVYAPYPGVTQQPYQPPAYAPRPPKDKSIALILELLPGLFGFLGFGWIYSGDTQTGIMWLVGYLIWAVAAVIIDIVTGGFGCICTLPINIAIIAVSVSNLNKYIKSHPEIFGAV